MDAGELLRAHHRLVGSFALNWVAAGLSDDQQRARPHPAANSPAWLLWHAARVEDWGVNRLVADRPQVLGEGGWAARLGVPPGRVGTGMTDEEVDEFGARVELGALRDYWRAVRERTDAVLAALPPAALDAIPEPAALRRAVFEEGAGAEAFAGLYADKSRAWLLAHVALNHPYVHLGEANLVRTMLSHPTP